MTDEGPIPNRSNGSVRAPLALVMILVAAFVAAGYFVFGGDSTPDPATPTNGSGTNRGDQNGSSPALRTGDADDEARRTEADLGNGEGALPQRGLFGLVTDEDGRAVEGAEVRLFRRDPGALIRRSAQRAAWPPDAQTRSNGEGRFWFGVDLAGANRFQILVRHPAFASARGFADLGPNEGLIDAGLFTLTRGVRLTGHVRLRANGLPVRGAEIVVHRRTVRPGDPPAPEPLLRTTTGFDGSFEIGPIPRTSVELEVRSEEFPGTFRRLDLRNDTPLELQIELDSPHVLAGTVVDDLQRPIGSARVLVTPAESDAENRSSPVTEERFADGDGLFRFANLPPGPVQVLVSAPGFESSGTTGPIPVDQENLEFTLRSLPSVWVEVREPDGRRAEEFDLRAWNVAGGDPDWLAVVRETEPVTVTPADLSFGRFRFGPLPLRQTVLEARVDGYAHSYSEPFDPSAWPDPAVIEIRLRIGASVAGQVLDQRGRPLQGALVRIRPRPVGAPEERAFGWASEILGPRGSSLDLRTDGDGVFSADRVAPGRYEVEITDPDHAAFVSQPILLSDRGRERLPTVQLDGGVRVSGTVEFDGQLAPRAEVRIFRRSAGEDRNVRVLAETRADAEGRFVLPRRLGAGDYRLSVARESDSAIRILLDHRASEQALEIRPNVPALELPIEISTRR